MDICRNTERSLSSYLDSELPADQMRALTAHLSACRACAAKLRTLRSSSKVFRSLSPGAAALTAPEQKFCRAPAAYRDRMMFMAPRSFPLELRLWKPALALLLFGILLWGAGFVSLPQQDSRLATARRVHQLGFSVEEGNI